MAKRKVSPDPAEAQRQGVRAAADKLTLDEARDALVMAWTAFIWLWMDSAPLRQHSGEFFAPGSIVREFLTTLRAVLHNVLPRGVAAGLEKAHAD